MRTLPEAVLCLIFVVVLCNVKVEAATLMLIYQQSATHTLRAQGTGRAPTPMLTRTYVHTFALNLHTHPSQPANPPRNLAISCNANHNNSKHTSKAF